MVVNLKKVIKIPQRMLWAFVMEGVETKNMLQTFARSGRKRLIVTSAKGPSEEEMRQAMAQLKDLPRFLPFFVFIMVPATGVTEGYVLLAVTLEKWLGQKVNLLPDRFRVIFQKEEPEKPASLEELPKA